MTTTLIELSCEMAATSRYCFHVEFVEATKKRTQETGKIFQGIQESQER